ncbi:unnamed protein product [Meloidogyne enterolobii]|uniref:Uncharacterized protein n=1 Tax=Meloidogyne enterolobii TaxID=390850 RepID=A0ACB1ATM2_MELEN
MVKFKTGVRSKPDDCLKNCSGHIFDGASANLLPFAYSLTEKKNVTKLKKGQLSERNKKDCNNHNFCGDEQLCMPWTSLEVAWNKCFFEDGKYPIFAHIHPIGEKLAKWNIKDLNGSEEFGLTIEEGGFSMDLKGKSSGDYNLTDKDPENHPYCVLKGKGFIKPVAWKINGTNPAPGYDYLLVFYMLPQSASRNHSKGEIVKDDPPDGPKCEELYIEFAVQ